MAGRANRSRRQLAATPVQAFFKRPDNARGLQGQPLPSVSLTFSRAWRSLASARDCAVESKIAASSSASASRSGCLTKAASASSRCVAVPLPTGSARPWEDAESRHGLVRVDHIIDGRCDVALIRGAMNAPSRPERGLAEAMAHFAKVAMRGRLDGLRVGRRRRPTLRPLNNAPRINGCSCFNSA